MRIITIILIACFSFNTYSTPLSERVINEMNSLDEKMGSGSYQNKVNKLLELDARKNVFRLQGLGRLFQDKIKIFSDLNKDFKAFEDAIGSAQKWQDLLELPDLSENKRENYLRHLRLEKKNLITFLKKWDQTQTTEYYRIHLSEIKLNEKQTAKLAIDEIKSEINKAIEKKFDFAYGETGLHELRRTLRWPMLELALFQDLFSVDEEKCSKSENDLFVIGINKNNSALMYNPNAVKEVDYCTYIKMLGAVELLGNIKDQLEQDDVLEDKVPKEIRKKTESVYNELFPSLMKNLKTLKDVSQ